jgi:DNA-binding transcriptional LysR family regulator
MQPVNLARFDLVSIRLVVFCSERGSLGQAAKLVHMTKSTASHRLACFEAKLGTPLFVRGHRGMLPTEAGRLVAAHGRLILRNLDQLSTGLTTLTLANPDRDWIGCGLK